MKMAFKFLPCLLTCQPIWQFCLRPILIISNICNISSASGHGIGYSAVFEKSGKGPFEDDQDSIIEIYPNQALYIDREKISNFCVYSKATVGSGKSAITTKTYTWVDGQDVYVLTDINEELSLQVIVNQIVNGSFTDFSYLE